MKILRLSIFALITFLATTSLSAKDQGEKKISAYGLSISLGASLSVSIKVNDVLVSSNPASEKGSIKAWSIPINGEVVPGENIIEVLIGTAEISPSATLESVVSSLPDEPNLRINFEKDHATQPKPGTYISKAENLETRRWEPELQEGKIKLPQKITIKFSAPMDHPVPLWANAKMSNLGQVQEDLVDMYRDIIKKLRAGDAESIGRMSKLAYQDAAIAYPIGGNAESRHKSDVLEIKDIISEPEMTIPDMLEPLECKEYAKGLLFECFATDGESPVRILIPNEDPIYFIFKFSVIDNKLQIVR